MLRIQFKREQWKGKEHTFKKNKIGKVSQKASQSCCVTIVKINIS